MFEAIAAVAAIIVEACKEGRSICHYIRKKKDYADKFEFNFNELKQQAEKLSRRKNIEETRIMEEKMKREGREGWIGRVKMAERELLKLDSKYENEIKCGWRFPRFWCRAKLSKYMAKKCKELQDLIDEGEFDDETTPEPMIFIDDAPRTEDKPWIHEPVEKILGYLRERDVKRIGLCGTVGIGKTTIMKNLNNNKEVKKMFDIVIWVSVSKAGSIEKVQDAITRRLKLKVEGGVNKEGGINEDETARLISYKLRGMRYLLLLDEVWGHLNLEKIGITNNNKDSRVVIASRFPDLCRQMEVNDLVQMKRLSKSEALKMFEEKVGRNIINPNNKRTAELVVRECCGLPLLIDKVAKNFRNKNTYLWIDGLRSLQRWDSNKSEGLDEVLEFLQFCYEDLKKDRKDCFLYGALFPEESDIFVDHLMECWKAEGFLHIAEFRDARSRGHKILQDLIDASLLEEGEMKEHVQMNKVIRKMALKISSGGVDHKFLARTCDNLEEAPEEEEWATASRISLIKNDLGCLPAAPNCVNLLTLLLQRNCNLKLIPDSFFMSMQRLRVLDLQESAITSLPPSLSCLTDLRALYLKSCKLLTELPSSLETLVQLEVLDIRHTGIISLPNQVGCLTQMRCLRMSSSNFGSENPTSKVISSLSLLEELIVDVDPNTVWSDEVVSTIMREVSILRRLTSLTFSFPKVEGLEIFITSSKVWENEKFTFQFVVGNCDSVKHPILDYFEYQSCRFLKYAKNVGVDGVIPKVLTVTNVFELVDHKGISSLSVFGTNNMSNLRACSVEGCEDIKCIIDGNAAQQPTLQWLERMDIKNAPSLLCIWDGPVPGGSLHRMTSLTLKNCPKLKKIFSKGLIEQLAELEHLSVKKCHEIEEIIIESENNCLDQRTLPRLKELVLRDLPKLRSITPNDSLIWPSLERVEIASCQSLLKLPFSGENAIHLRSIEAEESWWFTLDCHDAIKQRLRSLKLP